MNDWNYVNIIGVSYKVVKVNFIHYNKTCWSVTYIDQAGFGATGWFHESQFAKEALPPKPILRQGC